MFIRSILALLTLCMLLALSAPVRAAEAPSGLTAVIAEAPALSKWVGSKITFSGLQTARPAMVWPDGYEVRLAKVFESESLFVLQFVAPVGSTDTVYIERKNKRFLIVSVGAMAIASDSGSATLGLYRGTLK